MYSQLLARYPTASLLSELLQVENGKFVVRAMIQVGGVMLTTAMAAAPTVEQAEDQARLRALAVLGIYPNDQELQTRLVVSDPPRQSSGVEATNTQELGASQISDTRTAAWALEGQSPANTLVPADAITEEGYPFQELDLGLGSNGTGRGIHSSEVRHQSSSSSNGATLHTPEPQNGKRTHSRQRQTLAKSETSGPIDLSDIIAQTSVELKRLGWTDIQGRLHLQQAYGKRSRQQLTDEELLEFLQYLQTQPSPDEPLF